MNYQVPFYSNPDDNHCFQACLKMILKYFLPEKDFSWKDLDEISDYKVSGTWPIAGMLWLNKNGFDVIDIEDFDYEEVSRGAKKYLEKMYGKKFAEDMVGEENMEKEEKQAKKISKTNIVKRKIPEIEDINDLLSDGYLIICYLVWRDNDGKDIGHFVVIKGLNEKEVIINDPGLPPLENNIINKKEFSKRWSYPFKKMRDVIAVRKKV